MGPEEGAAYGVCPQHEGRPAIAACPRCGRYLCALCVSRGAEVSGQLLCRDCLGALSTRNALRREVAWENRRGTPYWRAFLATWRDVVFAPRAFFAGLEPEGSLFKALIFAAICVAVGFLGSLWGIGEAASALVGPSAAALVAAMAVGVAPLTYLLSFAATVLFLHLLARALGGTSGWRGTTRAVAYGQAAAVAEVIPAIGGILALVVRLSLYGWGVSAVHGFAVKKALAFYFVIVVVVAGFVYFGFRLLAPFVPAGV
ncbi:MAG: YIP1 family protein [Candidatus Coatesbacteria bacterium]|nr:MAG: YIP1 family protein [Candidatus Coatesbacteria bacterium]